MTSKYSEYDQLHSSPFKSTLSTQVLLDWWENEAKSNKTGKAALAKFVLDRVKKTPEICGTIADLSVIEKYPEEMALLLSGLFPAATFDRDLKAAVSPFGMDFFYSTPMFDQMAIQAMEQSMKQCPEDLEDIAKRKMLNGFLCILNSIYKVDVEWISSMEFNFHDNSIGTNRHFSMVIDIGFTECVCIGDPPVLTQDDIHDLLANTDNLDLWFEKLPPEQFEFRGFGLITPIDITETQVASSIKQDLLKKETLVEENKFVALQSKFRDLMKLPQMTIGIGSFTSGGEDFFFFGPQEQQIVTTIEEHITRAELFELYDIKAEERGPLLIEDVQLSPLPKKLKQRLADINISNLALLPLRMDDEFIGVLQLGTPYPNKLNNISLKLIYSLLPIIATAVQRSADEIENEVQQIIKSRYTSLHKTVEWKFRQAAKHVRESKLQGIEENVEDIVFEDVFPLYGATDIRNSSIERNQAIQADLSKQLDLAIAIMDKVIDRFRLPIYQELRYRLQKENKRIKKKLISRDEGAIHDILGKEIEPLFKHIVQEHPDLESAMKPYFDSIDNRFGVLYEKRKDFEESVAQINKAVYRLIESEEEKSQVMFPYYFENYKTDGVEYNIYLGQSLVNDRKFDPVYLRNLRLWQLLVMCKAANVAQSLLPKLAVKLEATHLILVQSAPMSIRFRTDEKKFDVDGAYNVRYEIMKKRVDKALIRNTNERLTQVGMLAIVYSSVKEREEYEAYLNYLHHLGCIERQIEDLELEELQGVDGLRALRVKLRFNEDLGQFPTFGEEVLSKFEGIQS